MGCFTAVSPTVLLRVSVPSALPTGAGWGWETLPEADPIGYDHVYNCTEVATSLRTWGTLVARSVVGSRHDRFAITAYGMVTGVVIGRDTWTRSSETHHLVPHGEPWCVWAAQVAAARARGIEVPAR